MRLRVPVTLGVAFSIFAASAGADTAAPPPGSIQQAGTNVVRQACYDAFAALDGLIAKRKKLEDSMANPSASDGIDLRRYLVANFGGADRADASPRYAVLEGELRQVRASIQPRGDWSGEQMWAHAGIGYAQPTRAAATGSGSSNPPTALAVPFPSSQ